MDPRIPIVSGPMSAGGSAGSQTLTVAHRWREASTVTTLFLCAPPAVAAGSAQAATKATTIPVFDDTAPA